MAQVLQIGKHLYRINPSNRGQIEISMNNGLQWIVRYRGNPSMVGQILEIELEGTEIVAYAEKGVFRARPNYSTFFRKPGA